MDRALDLAFEAMMITLCACITPFWAWFIFRLYVPKNKNRGA